MFPLEHREIDSKPPKCAIHKRFKHATHILRISTFKGKYSFALKLSRRDNERASTRVH